MIMMDIHWQLIQKKRASEYLFSLIWSWGWHKHSPPLWQKKMPVFSLKLTILWFLKFDSYPHRPETIPGLDQPICRSPAATSGYQLQTIRIWPSYDPMINHNPSPKKPVSHSNLEFLHHRWYEPAGPVMSSVRLFPRENLHGATNCIHSTPGHSFA